MTAGPDEARSLLNTYLYLLWLAFAGRCCTNVYSGVVEDNVWSICERCIHITRHLVFSMHPSVSTNIWKRTRRLLIGPLIPDTTQVGTRLRTTECLHSFNHTLVILFNLFIPWVHIQFWNSLMYVKAPYRHSTLSYNEDLMPPSPFSASPKISCSTLLNNSAKSIGLLARGKQIFFKHFFFLINVVYIFDLHEGSRERFPIRHHFYPDERKKNVKKGEA